MTPTPERSMERDTSWGHVGWARIRHNRWSMPTAALMTITTSSSSALQYFRPLGVRIRLSPWLRWPCAPRKTLASSWASRNNGKRNHEPFHARHNAVRFAEAALRGRGTRTWYCLFLSLRCFFVEARYFRRWHDVGGAAKGPPVGGPDLLCGFARDAAPSTGVESDDSDWRYALLPAPKLSARFDLLPIEGAVEIGALRDPLPTAIHSVRTSRDDAD